MNTQWDNSKGDALVAVADPEDAELLRAARAGNQDAYGLLYQRHAPGALNFARRLVDDEHAAQDILHEAFMSVVRAISNGLGPHKSFPAYLTTSIKSAAVRSSQKAAREVPMAVEEFEAVRSLPQDDQMDRLLDQVAATDANARIRAALSTLPIKWQRILWLADVLGEPPRRVGPLMGISPNAASALLGRAREGLKTAYLTVGTENAVHPAKGS